MRLVDAAAVLVLTATPAAAQTLGGRVLSAGTEQPIAGAALTLLDRNGKVVTTALAGDSGTFRMRAPAATEYTIRVEHIAFTAATLGPVRLHPSGVVEVTVRLDERVIPINALTVEVERRVRKLENAGFYDRRAHGIGTFLERADIELRPVRTAADIMRRVSGLRVITSGFSADVEGRGACRPVVYLDGVAVSNRRPRSPVYNLEDLPATDIEAMESYSGPGSAPPQYSMTDNPCGVVLFWTTKPGR